MCVVRTLRLGMALRIVCACFCLFGCVRILHGAYFTSCSMLHNASQILVKNYYAACFLGYLHSTTFGHLVNRCELCIMRVVGKLCFQILFEFVTLHLQMEFINMCLCFCLFFGECISNGDRFMDCFSYVVLFYKFE